MWSTDNLTCLVRGHAFRNIRHDGAAYLYCLRCGKAVWRHSHVRHWHRRLGPAAPCLAQTAVE